MSDIIDILLIISLILLPSLLSLYIFSYHIEDIVDAFIIRRRKRKDRKLADKIEEDLKKISEEFK
jgi:hypothetical protein